MPWPILLDSGTKPKGCNGMSKEKRAMNLYANFSMIHLTIKMPVLRRNENVMHGRYVAVVQDFKVLDDNGMLCVHLKQVAYSYCCLKLIPTAI